MSLVLTISPMRKFLATYPKSQSKGTKLNHSLFDDLKLSMKHHEEYGWDVSPLMKGEIC